MRKMSSLCMGMGGIIGREISLIEVMEATRGCMLENHRCALPTQGVWLEVAKRDAEGPAE